jgi:Uma2 family endonuclease
MMTQEQVAPKELFTFNNATFPLADGASAEAFFYDVCAEFANKRIEQDRHGNVHLILPAGGELSYQNAEVTAQLEIWSDKDGRGHSFDPSLSFIFPDGSRRSPNASWVSIERLKTLTLEERREFLKLVPEFVVEIKSPSDRYSELQAKMEEYRRNGVTLGWLIHPGKRTVAIYRQDAAVEVLEQPEIIAADAPLTGLVLDLKPIWQGLNF